MEKVLIIGGTHFIGRNLVEALLELNCYELALFNRGLSNADLFPQVRRIIGDRTKADIDKIAAEDWDYIIDLSCYFPASLKRLLPQISSSLKRYIFISTCSVYDMEATESVLKKESAKLLTCNLEEEQNADPGTYGKRKAACEDLVKSSGLTYSILRPALVYGPYDTTDRLYYWLYQIYHNKELLLANRGSQQFSITYVSDLVSTIVRSLETYNNAIYNISSHPQVSIAQIVNETETHFGKQLKRYSVDSAFLKNQGVQQWTDLPLWLDSDQFTFSNATVKDQLTFTPKPFRESIKKTIEYFEALKWPAPKYGMDDHRKETLISMAKNK
jgi:2'-hydroxyisoflavone reductase